MSVHAYHRLIDALERHGSTGNGRQHQCPAHEDRVASLTITDADDRVLIHCHAGCDSLAVLDAIGLDWSALFDDRATGKGWSTRTLRRVGAEANGDGRVTLGSVRYLPGARDGQTKSLAVKGSIRDLWPDPASIDGDVLYVVEGEPDAVTAAQLGLPAVGVPGSGKWRTQWAKRIADGRRRVVVVADADDAGRKAASKWAAAVAEHCEDVRVLDLAPELCDGFDLGDFVADAATDEDRAAARGMIERAAEVAPRHGANDGSPSEPPVPAPDTVALLNEIGKFIRRFVILPTAAEYRALALFTLHTWAFDAAHATPYIVVESPEKQSGKTRLLEVLELVCRGAVKVASITAAGLFQTIGNGHPTLLIDEADAIFAGNSERNEDLRGVLNAGNAPGSKVIRGGRDGTPVSYDVYSPKVIAGIATGRLPDTIRDRAIVVPIDRKLRTERVARLRRRMLREQLELLQGQYVAWAAEHHDRLFRYIVPDRISDRLEEAWEPLFAIADLAGGDWPKQARKAAEALAGADAEDDNSASHMLLVALRDVFDGDAMATRDILTALNDDEQLPFGAWSDGKGMSARELGRLLKRYRIKPSKIRVGDATLQGYRREWFERAWGRYGGLSSGTSGTTAAQSQIRALPDPEQTAKCSGYGEPANPHSRANVPDVLDNGHGTWTDAEIEQRVAEHEGRA